MEITRQVVLFPAEQVFAIVGDLWVPQNPYALSLTDIFNDKSGFTHKARDHMHRPGRVFLDNVQMYSLHDSTCRVCKQMSQVHVGTDLISAATDIHPEKFKGNAHKRQEHAQRQVETETLQFALHQQVFAGTVDPLEVYRKSESFIGVSDLRPEPGDAWPDSAMARFFEQIGCPQPQYMAVNLGRIFHS